MQASAPLLQEVGDVEQNYSNSIQKLLRSSSYSFHSNILMKWLGSEPYQEIGYIQTRKLCEALKMTHSTNMSLLPTHHSPPPAPLLPPNIYLYYVNFGLDCMQQVVVWYYCFVMLLYRIMISLVLIWYAAVLSGRAGRNWERSSPSWLTSTHRRPLHTLKPWGSHYKNYYHSWRRLGKRWER